jgi:hypothetical protein
MRVEVRQQCRFARPPLLSPSARPPEGVRGPLGRGPISRPLTRCLGTRAILTAPCPAFRRPAVLLRPGSATRSLIAQGGL